MNCPICHFFSDTKSWHGREHLGPPRDAQGHHWDCAFYQKGIELETKEKKDEPETERDQKVRE